MPQDLPSDSQQQESGPAPQRVLIELLRAAFAVRRRFETVMQSHGVTGQQYNVLRILRGAGEPLPTMDVAERMIEPEPGITRMIRRLETKGLVERHRCTDDARRTLCALTAEGHRVLHELDGPVAQTNEHLVEDLVPDQIEGVLNALNRIQSRAALDGG